MDKLINGKYDVSTVPSMPGMWQLRELVDGQMKQVIAFRGSEFSTGLGAIHFLSMSEKSELRKMFQSRFETYQQTRAKY